MFVYTIIVVYLASETALGIERRLEVSRVASPASKARPLALPIEIPKSDADSEGASFTPSPT